MALAVHVPLTLDRSAPVPLGVQLADGLRAAAGRGGLRVGDRMPSTRALAVELGVSRTVAAAAYDQLVAEGWLGPRRGSGTYVVAAPPGVASAAAPTVPDTTGAGGTGAGGTGAGGAGAGPSAATVAPSERVVAPLDPFDGPAGDRIDVRPGTPCLDVLDTAAWRRAWRRAGDRAPLARPEYGGVEDFRTAVAELLLRHRGLDRDAGGVLATAGTTAAFGELLAVLRPVRVAIEDPGYRRAVGALRAAGVKVVGVPVDADGLVVDAVPEGVDLVYCTPAHHYPLGVRMSVARRAALVGRARQEGFVVVEDDYDGELRYDVAPLPVLAALGPDVVVHLGTASKIASPTLGVGWAVAPPALHDAVLARRWATGSRPSPAGQLVLAELAADGALSRHLARLRREHVARRADVVAAVSAAGHRVIGDEAGAHLVVPVADARAERAAVGAAVAAGLAVQGLVDHHLGPRPQDAVHGLLVGWAGPGRAQLTDALHRLRSVLGEVPPGPDRLPAYARSV